MDLIIKHPGWEVLSLRDGPRHVLPIDDYRPHLSIPGCWCGPTQDDEDDGVWVHHSLDRRENYETGCRSPS